MPLPPLMHMLDPRSAAEAARHPIVGAVNIPLAHLEARSQELPAKSEKLMVVGPSEVAGAAVQWLRKGGRKAELSQSWEFGNSGPGRLWSPTPFLERTIPNIGAGVALDFGCGSGRDAVALSAGGWQVVGSDILPDALARGRDLAGRYSTHPVYWVAADLEQSLPFQPASFDLIVLFRFLPKEALPLLPRLLKKGGSILLEAFTPAHLERHGKPASAHRLLNQTEGLGLFAGMRVQHHSYAWRDDGSHTVRLWAVSAW